MLKRLFRMLNNERGEVYAGAAAVLTPGSASATVPVPGAAPAAAPAASAFAVPDAFKDKPYLKGVDSYDKVFTMLDGAQTLIGKKGVIVPGEDAKPEDYEKFYNELGRPKTPKEYVFDTADKTDPKILEGVQGAMHKHGLTAKQAAGVWTDVEAAITNVLKEKGIAVEQANTDFTKIATDTFGVNRDAVLANGKALIKEYASPAVAPLFEKIPLDKLPNEALIVFADVLNNISKKYINPDGLPGRPNLPGGGTPDALRDKARALMAEQSKHGPMSVEFMNLQKQIDSIYDDLRKSGVKL